MSDLRHRLIVSVYIKSKYKAYKAELIDSTGQDDGTEVYVYRMSHGISKFTLTLHVTDHNIEEVIT